MYHYVSVIVAPTGPTASLWPGASNGSTFTTPTPAMTSALKITRANLTTKTTTQATTAERVTTTQKATTNAYGDLNL